MTRRQKIPADPYWANRYFTDGERLYRFVCWVGRSVDATLGEFEDCHSLDVILLRVSGRNARPLRPVPAA